MNSTYFGCTAPLYPKRDIYIFTDVGEEIDDEIALFFFFKHYASNYRHVYVIMTEGALGSSLNAEDRVQIFSTYFTRDVTVPRNVDIITPGKLSRAKGQFDILQIAPLTDSLQDGNRITQWLMVNGKSCDTHYLMGQRSSKCLNTTGSFGERSPATEYLFADYEQQVYYLSDTHLVEIGTNLCRKIPLTKEIVTNLPLSFQEKVFDKAYEQFVGRVPAHLPFCYNVTVHANLPTLRAYIQGHEREFDEFKLGMHVRDKDLLQEYAAEFASAAGTEELQKVVYECAQIVCFLTRGMYTNASFQAGEHNFTGYEHGKSRWITYAKKLTPAYDLVAMFVATNDVTLDDKNTIIAKMNSTFLEQG